MDLDVLVPDLDRVVVASFDLVVDVEFPLSSLIPFLPGTLYNVVAEDTGDLKGVVDLHARVHAYTAILIEVISSLLASSKEDSVVISEGNTGRAKDLAISAQRCS